ncbi:MAG: PBP1A family penicillin-binding protein [Alphaproteobacteria bacterium]|jgi:penicillin-binding protein 1A|nr:PBP1A family penicillin-binding protein [Alphaproteobacteria bacterium]
MVKQAKKRKNNIKKKKSNDSFMKLLLRVGFIAMIWLSISLIFYVIYLSLSLPDVKQIKNRQGLRPTITFLDTTGKQIVKYGDSYDHVIIENIPNDLINAVVSTEDRKFFSHNGFDIIGFMRAMAVNLSKMRFAQGGSTITQQLAKNLFLTNQKSINRKIQEMILALYIETQYSKEEILESYLNNVYLGAGNYGVESASMDYFGKHIYDINFEEAIILAGLLKAPSSYSPKYHKEKAFKRALVVASTMRDNGFSIPEINFEKNVTVKNHRSNRDVDNYRYFTDMASDRMYKYLGDVKQDIIVKTTYDMNLQKIAEQSVSKYEQDIKNKQANQVAFVSMQKDGSIVAMLGGFDYYESQLNRVYQTKRQTGSAFKPVVYLSAIEKGLTPYTEIDDAPLKIGNWEPNNFDYKFHGKISAMKAFAKSYNIPAIKVMQKYGRGNVLKMAKKLGITSKIESNLTTALGTNSLSLLELVNAYVIMSNEGYKTTPYLIREIVNKDGDVLYKHEIIKEQVLKSKHLKHINRMLREVVDNGSGKKSKVKKIVSYGKTGTTQKYRDAWFIGYNDKLVTGIWLGNDNATPTNRVTGGSFPAKIWKNYNERAYKNAEARNIVEPNLFWRFIKSISF